MDTKNPMVSTSFKLSFKYNDNFVSIGGEAAIHVKDGETLEQAFARSWASVQTTVDNQIDATVVSLTKKDNALKDVKA